MREEWLRSLRRVGSGMLEGWSDESPITLILPDPVEVRELPWERAPEWGRFVSELEPRSAWGGRAPFGGGWVGFVTYDASATSEGASLYDSPPAEPAAWFARHDSGYVSQGGQLRSFGDPPPLIPASGCAAASNSATEIIDSLEGRFQTSVQEIRRRIAAGDVYQVNLTRCFRRGGDVDAVALYLALTGSAPPVSSAFLKGDDWTVVSASPEIVLDHHLREGRADSRPIKGTVLAGGDAASSAATLLASAKDASEHLMIVDLVRNDLGKVATPGTVRVSESRAVRRVGGILHLESIVTADTDAATTAGLLQALLPAGSITGAPKRAAVAAIRELEPVPRGVYTGAIGWIDDSGHARFSVAIRTAVVAAGHVRYHAGGGIVWDSSPELEDQESRWKAEAFLQWMESIA